MHQQTRGDLREETYVVTEAGNADRSSEAVGDVSGQLVHPLEDWSGSAKRLPTGMFPTDQVT